MLIECLYRTCVCVCVCVCEGVVGVGGVGRLQRGLDVTKLCLAG